MASGLFSGALDALTTKKGAALAVVAILGVAALVNIGRPSRVDRVVSPAQAAEPSKPAAPMVDATGTFSPAQVAAIQRIVKDYLIAHPEVMIEVTKEIEKKQQEQQAADQFKVLAENKKRIFFNASDFVFGNPKGDITVVEFFDYNCGWCKRALDDLQKLAKADSNVRIVMKEFPIFGEPSQLAARAAMAAVRQGKYWEFHSALMKEKQVTKDNLFPIAEKVGLNVARLKTDMADPKIEEAIKETTVLAQQLNIEGTPGFIVDGKVNVGYVPAEGLRQMIGEARKTGCQMC